MFGVMAVLSFTAAAWAQDTTLTLTRNVPAGNYMPGASLDIQITFTKSGTQPITALGLYETLPGGWTFDSVVGGAVPQIYRLSEDDVEFAWFVIPAFPATFTYRVQVPEGETGTKEMSGYAEYRTDGPPLFTPTVMTTILESPPVASFTADPVSGCAPLDIQFTDTSTGNPDTWAWDFGDGGSSSEQNPLYTYNLPGIYTVTLTASNAAGPDSIVQNNLIVALGPPTASFTATPTSGCAPLDVDFTDTSTGSPTSYSWDFGDGGTSTEPNPSHTYVAPGNYTATLTVTNDCGQDTTIQTGLIVVGGKPSASFTAEPTAGCAPLEVDFTDTSTGSPTSYAWDFGDGATSTEPNPSHTYVAPGNYSATLIVTNDCGQDVDTQLISVGGPPEASFTATPTSGCAPIEVDFTDTSTGSPTAYDWDFGDGATSTEPNPSHTYMAPGNYTATLTVTNDCGQDTTIQTGLIVVGGETSASFTATPTSGVAPLLVQFTDTSTGGPTSRSWDFGDGGSSTSPNPAYTYTSAGTYTVTLTVSNACGSDDASTIISVSPANRAPVLDPVDDQPVDEAQVLSVPLSATDPDGDDLAFSVVGLPIFGTLTDNGDGTATLDVSPDYTSSGAYPGIVIKVTDDGTPSKTDSETITITVYNVNRPPVANAGNDFSVQVATTATLNGSSSFDPDGDLITYNWTFNSVPPGSGLTNAVIVNPAQPNASFTPDVVGAYILRLVVSDNEADGAPDFVTVTATPPPNVPPVAVAGDDQSAGLGVAVTLDGGDSYDPDDGPAPLAFAWSFESVPADSVLTDADITGANDQIASFTPDAYGDYVLGLVVDDGADFSLPDLLTVTAENTAPNADAGPDQSVTLGEQACLDGSAGNDPDDGPMPLTYAWTFLSVPDGSALTNADIVGADTASPCFLPDLEGSYVLELLVSDGMSSDTDDALVAANTPAEMRNVDELVKVQFIHHKHNLDRETRMITSTADMTIKNTSQTPIAVPIRALFIIDNPNVAMPDANGTAGDNYFYDIGLTTGIEQLAPGESVSFEIKFVYHYRVRFDFTAEVWGMAP